MTMSTLETSDHAPLAKRRRLNESLASKTLRKPFKSPFNTTVRSTSKLLEDHVENENKSVQTRSNAAAHEGFPQTTGVVTVNTPKVQKSAGNSFTDSAGSQALERTGPRDAHAKDAKLEARLLAAQITAVQADIDMLSQAHQIMQERQSAKHEELPRLIDKWRSAAREAAEDVFESTKERVNDMGGLSGMREANRSRQAWLSEWNEQPTASGQSESMNDEQLCERESDDLATREKKAELKDWKCAAETALDRRNGTPEEDAGSESNEFTIDMMLRSMDIDLDLIGYDTFEQRWKDT